MTVGRDSSGIALFMVISAVSVLAILVTEFTYIAQISQSIAFGGLDQAKAHYLAKSGLKLSLLRLKAYQQVRELVGGQTAGLPGVPRSVIQKIWNFPFFYPIPTNLPSMTQGNKDAIEKFQKGTTLEGRFSAIIESESSKYNLNLLLGGYQPSPSPSPISPVAQQPNSPDQPNPQASNPTPAATFNPEIARQNLYDYFNGIIRQKTEADPDFGSNFRDFKLEEFIDRIATWSDRNHERRTSNTLDKVPMKRAPFYSITELHMLPGVDDEIYDLFAPNLTASRTPGININTMPEPTLRALVPTITKEEVVDFFKYRDSEDADNSFKEAGDFYKYLMKGVTTFKNNQQEIDKFQADLAKRNLYLVTDETQFKITVRAQVNNAIRTIEAWVELGSASTTSKPKGPQSPDTAPQPGGPFTPPVADAGLKITFMRIL